MFNSFICHLRNVNHSFLARCEFDKCTEFFDTYYFTFVNFTFDEVVYDCLDILHSLIHASLVKSAYRYETIICDINLNTALINNCIDCLTTLSNYFTNLCRINSCLDNLRCIFTNCLSRFSNCRLHTCIHNEKSGFSCSCDSLFNNRSCKTVNLNIHLDCCNTLCSTCYLKVHITKEIFKSLNICKNDIIIICITCNKSTRNTSNHSLNRNTSCHK